MFPMENMTYMHFIPTLMTNYVAIKGKDDIN